MSTLSPEEVEQIALLKIFLNISSNLPNSSSIIMKKFMRLMYDEINMQRRKKRQLNYRKSSLSLSDDLDSIISLFNQYNESNYYFQYNSSLENLTGIELILPIKRLTNFSTIEIKSNEFNLLFQPPFQLDQNLLKINLTKYIQTFPVKFFIRFNQISLHSSGFLTLYFRRSIISHSRIRRDLLSFDEDNQLITYPNDPSYCQVRPLRTSFAELNWTSWIIEPSSYEMNICSGICHTNSDMPSYFTMQNLLHQIFPKKMPTLCCKPKRFSSTILLYYDGPNLILKRYDNMRVIECGCS
jgi:hypothetical protein